MVDKLNRNMHVYMHVYVNMCMCMSLTYIKSIYTCVNMHIYTHTLGVSVCIYAALVAFIIPQNWIYFAKFFQKHTYVFFKKVSVSPPLKIKFYYKGIFR